MEDENEELSFVTFNAEGERMECDVLFMFESLDGRNFIVYTDNTLAETGELRVYASLYNPEELEPSSNEEEARLILEPITEQSDWDIVNEILREMASQVSEEIGADGGAGSAGIVTEPPDGEHDVIDVHYPEGSR